MLRESTLVRTEAVQSKASAHTGRAAHMDFNVDFDERSKKGDGYKTSK